VQPDTGGSAEKLGDGQDGNGLTHAKRPNQYRKRDHSATKASNPGNGKPDRRGKHDDRYFYYFFFQY
jgi:hypothetical protein